MKDENKCESPLGGWWGECERTDKNGHFIGMGIGKIIADVTYYNKSQGQDNLFTYGMCKDCTQLYELIADLADDPTEDNVVTEIKYRETGKTLKFNTPIVLMRD